MADISGTMGALYILLPISLLLVVAIGAFFWWAIFSGQFDDTEQAGRQILLDRDTPEPVVEQGETDDTGDSPNQNLIEGVTRR